MLEKALTCPNLHQLVTSSKLGKALTECRSDLMSSKLMFLNLYYSEIEDDSMRILGKLPRLVSLELGWESFVGVEMTCPANSFLCLKKLALIGLPKLREWRMESGTMPILSEVKLADCSCLQMVPEGLSGISTLRKLVIRRMPELKKRVTPSGHDFHKIRHVSSIIIED